MIKKKIIITIFIVMLAITGLFLLKNSRNSQTTIYMNSSWSYGYGDINEIAEASDIIALIHVNDLLNSNDNTTNFSFFEVEVIDGIQGCKNGELLKIFFYGCIKNNVKYEIKEDPLLEKGQEFLIFAQKNENGTCTILGGPQGRLVYKDGMLNSLHNTNSDFNQVGGIDIKNENAHKLISELKRKIS